MVAQLLFLYLPTKVGRGLEFAQNPLPGMRLGVKVDNSDYQKIKYLVIIYNHDSD
jgi:hypothetical protein